MPTLADQQIEAQRRLRARAAAAVTSAWFALPSYNETDVPRFLATVVPLMTAAQRASVLLTSAYLARTMGIQPVRVDPAEILERARNGAAPADVYRRPFVTVWTALANRTSWEDAVAAGVARATAAAEMDVQLAHRETARDVFKSLPSVVGYRRVPDAGACNLCLLASTQRYNTEDLLPIHNRCGCTVQPIIGTSDPGRVVDPDLLAELKTTGAAGDLSLQRGATRAAQRAEQNRARATTLTGERRTKLLRRASQQDALAIQMRARRAELAAKKAGIRGEVRDHGELGPVLVNGAHDFATLV